MHTILLIITEYSYIGIFAALGLGILGLPIPDETLLAFSGFLIFQGKLNFLIVLPVAFFGTSCGITVSYLLGKYGSNYISGKFSDKYPPNFQRLQKAEEYYIQYGKFALIAGYFIPGVRHITAIFAGISNMPYRQFALLAYTGALLWTSTFLILGYVLGHQWYLVSHLSNRFFIPLIILVGLALFLAFYIWKKN